MPITKANIVTLLNDPALTQINFTVRELNVSFKGFSTVADDIDHDDIVVVPGKSPGLSIYDRGQNHLEVDPNGNPPLSLGDNALIVHECVHAISDISGRNLNSYTDEVAAYIAQFTYMQIKSPSPHIGLMKVPEKRTWAYFQETIMEMIDYYKLTSKEGFGARIHEFDIFTASERLHKTTQYSGVALDLISTGGGVPIKDANTMRALRAALVQARWGR